MARGTPPHCDVGALPAVRLGLAIVVRSKMPQKKRDDDVVMEEVRPARFFSTLQPTTS